jgi:hypothetical protein
MPIEFKCLKRLAGPTGLEPATSCVTGRRSNQAELRPPREKCDLNRTFIILSHQSGRPRRSANLHELRIAEQRG